MFRVRYRSAMMNDSSTILSYAASRLADGSSARSAGNIARAAYIPDCIA